MSLKALLALPFMAVALAGAVAATVVAATAAPGAALAADPKYPVRPVRLVVPFPPGAASDFLGRTLGVRLFETWGQQVVVDNRPGAGGNIGANIVAKAPADGYTLFMVGLSHAANLSLYRKLDYHPLRDFTPITQVVSIDTFLAVHPSLPVKSVKELLALARAKPGGLNYASGGNGSSPHMAMELFKSLAKVDIVHVPYKGTESVTGLMRGEAGMIFENLISIGAQIKSGKLRALAIGSPRRSAAMPELPTLAESALPGFEVNGWYGLFAPRGTTPATLNAMQEAVAKAMRRPAVAERLSGDGAVAVTNTPAAFAKYLRADSEKWAKVIKRAKLAPETL
jgi:tripartite-type tricarboxylate transporter receptor subunit TctC